MSFVFDHVARGARASAAALLLACTALLPGVALAQHSSSLCPAQTATVTDGGTVSINITACEQSGNGGLGAIDGGSFGPADMEDHGIATTRRTGGQWFLDYSHSGSTGVGSTDVFELSDGSLAGSGDIQFTITITTSASAISVDPGTLPTLTAGAAFSQTLTASGGLAPYTYTLQSGALPAGLSLTSGGVLSGTPTQRGAYSFSVRATDSATPTADFVDKGYTGTVENPSLALVAATGSAIQSTPFSQTLATTGGVAPHSYQLETGSLPAGITLSGAGVVSGTTSAAPGNYPVTIRVTDSSTGPGSYFELESYTLTVSPPPSVSIAVSPASVSEDGATNLTYTATRSLNLSSPTVVNLTTSGTATSGVDYTGGVATVTIPAGATTVTVTINPTVDGTVEADETVTLTVAAGSGYTIGAPASATGNILNDDVPTATLSVSPAAVAEDGAPNLVYTVSLNQANPSAATSVNYTIGGTATNGTDYATIASPLVIAAGSTTGTITVNPTADATIETDETVALTLAAGAGYTIGVPNSATATILNDDLPNLTINDVTANEGSAGVTNFTFTVSLSAPAGPGGVTFDIASANGSATAGVDYVANSLVGQTIPAGSSTYTFTVQVNGDALNEPSETFFVNVTNVVNAVVVDGQGVGTITNDDPLPSLSIADAAVTEGNAGTVNAVFNVTLSAASGQTVAVNYATADGTATQPGDYTATSGTLTFTPGQTTRTVTVPVNGETVPEANETFFVNLSGATNATIGDNQGVGMITNDDVPITVGPASVPAGAVAAAYSQAISASGGTGPYSFAVTAGALPAGLTLSPAGALAGAPAAGGTFNFTVTATDSSPFPGPFSGSQAYSLTIAPPTITLPTTTLAGGTLGAAYSASIAAASGGTAPYVYAVTAGVLPGGLSLDPATGAISGTPSTLGAFNFSVTATDASTGTGPYTATQAYGITVIDVPPTATGSTLSVAYNAPATSVPLNLGGGAPASLSIIAAPSHGTAVVTGPSTISYQPSPGYAGPDSFTYTATNSGGTSAPATVTITVNDPATTITASAGLAAAVAAPYTQTFTFNGGAQPWTGYQVTNVPAGLAITGTTANTVTVSGTPTQAGSFNLNVSATDASTGNGPFTVDQDFALTVSAPTITLSPAAATFNPAYGAPYSQAFTAGGGSGPYTYVATGTLPPGLALSGGTLSGTPTAPGTYAFTITATDTGSTGTGAPFTAANSYTIVVAAPTILPGPATLADPLLGTTYSASLGATGGVAPYTFAVTAGSLPAGLSLSASGVLSGSSVQVGSYAFTVTATDANGQAGSRAYAFTIAAPMLALTPAAGTLVASYGAPYSAAFVGSGGVGPYSYASTGSLPPGVTFAGGTLSGTPTAPGTYAFTVTATDTGSTGAGAPFTVSANYTLQIAAPVIAVSPATLAPATAATPYSQSITTSGGVAPYGFTVSAGALPAGLTLGTAGQLAGTPTASGTFAFTVRATDANGQFGERAYSLVVAVPTLAVTPATVAAATAGAAYSQAFTVTGGTAPYAVTLTGPLPAGLSFDAANLRVTGTPTQSGSFNFSLQAVDSTSGTPGTATASYTLVVAAPTLTLTPATVPAGTAGVAYRQAFSTTGGIAPYRYAVASGALPAGLVLNGATGVLSGTPTVAGTFNFSLRSTDSTTGTAATTTVAYTLTLSAPTITITPATLPAAIANTAYAQTLTAAGGTAPYTFTVATGVLPGGLALATDGRITGTPTADGSFAFTVRATDALGFAAAQAYTLTVAPRPDPTRDPEVRGLLDAQARATQRFATAQIDNFRSRLDSLHGGAGEGGLRNGLAFMPSTRCAGDERDDELPNCRGLEPAREGIGAAEAAGGDAGADAGSRGDAASGGSGLGVWIGGALRSGSVDSRGGSAGLDFETDGVSLGVDLRTSPSFAFGAGIGYGRDRTGIGTRGSRVTGESYTLAGYASYHPGTTFFLDGLLGWQALSYDLRRHVTLSGSTVEGSRDGAQWFGSVSAGADLTHGAWDMTPFGRIDVTRAELDGYQEQGDPIYSLAYGTQTVDTTTASVGLTAGTRRATGWGTFSPLLRIEYQHDLQADGDTTVRYADLAGPLYSTRIAGFDRSRYMLGIGATFVLRSDFSIRVEYRGLFGNSGDRDNALQLNFRKSY